MKNHPKILLLLPPSFLYPMGPAYVMATLINAGYSFDIFTFLYDNRAWFKHHPADNEKETFSGNKASVINISQQKSIETLYEIILREKYDYILTGGLVGFFRWFYNILPQIKGYSPDCKIIMGGGITRDLNENILFEKLRVDYILKGEAETNLIQLLTLLKKGENNIENLANVPGLCWKEKDASIRKNKVIRYDVLTSSILPAWDVFPIEDYIALSDTLFRYELTFFPILMGRGCPNVCAFCSPSIGQFTPRSIDNVINEMKLYRGKYDFDFFFIYSEIAFADEAYTQEFCQKYKETFNKPWTGQLRTDVNFSAETYRLMKASGCMFLNLGFESACDRILKVMKKRTTLQDHMRNMTLAKEAGLTIFGNFIFGHETETAEEIKKTFDFLNEHDLISSPANGLAVPIIYPGTAYYKRAEEKGLVEDPHHFLLSYSLKAGISDVGIREKNETNRLHITALSNDDFYETICAENIKHSRLFWERHQAIEVERAFKLSRNAGFAFQGKCPTCENPLEFDVKEYLNPLSVSKFCPQCCYTVKIDNFQFAETKDYLTLVKKKLDSFNKIVVFGSWIMDVFFCGSLSFPYEKVIAWIDPEDPEVSNYRYFYHIPQMSLGTLRAQKYDAIISLQPRALSSPTIIEKFGIDAQCEIINLFPDTLNVELVKKITKKRIAISGHSGPIQKIEALIKSEGIPIQIDKFDDVWDIKKAAQKYDYVIFDKKAESTDCQEFTQNSQYQTSEILYPEYLYDGGYFFRHA